MVCQTTSGLRRCAHLVTGDLVFFHGLGNNILVLNSMKAINDLLEKKGSIYSDWPSFTVVGELMGLGQVSIRHTTRINSVLTAI